MDFDEEDLGNSFLTEDELERFDLLLYLEAMGDLRPFEMRELKDLRGLQRQRSDRIKKAKAR
jgi:hypothetical protein